MIQAIIMDIGGVVAPDIWEQLFFSESRISSLSHFPRSTLLRVGRKNFSLFAYRRWNRSNSWQALERAYWASVSADLGIKLDAAEIENKTTAVIQPLLDLSKIKEFSSASGLRVVFCSNDTPFWYYRNWTALNWGDSYSSEDFVMSFDFGQSKQHPRSELFKACAEVLKTAAGSTLFIDNQLDNLRSARRFGFRTLHFQSEFARNNMEALISKMAQVTGDQHG
jgi:FMN phosphatase YigB (HAD superfamily)